MFRIFACITIVYISFGCKNYQTNQPVESDPDTVDITTLYSELPIEIAIGNRLNIDLSGARFYEKTGSLGLTQADYWSEKNLSIQQIEDYFSSSVISDSKSWHLEKSHPTGGDQWGDVYLANGSVYGWMYRPGGLGVIVGKNSKIFLVYK